MVNRHDTDHVSPPATVTQSQDALDKLPSAYFVFNDTTANCCRGHGVVSRREPERGRQRIEIRQLVDGHT